jgi:hypothetical protein
MPRKGPAKKATCQLCNELIALNDDNTIRQHGFKKQKTSLRNRKLSPQNDVKTYCKGGGELPYEISKDCLKKYVIDIQNKIDKLNFEISSIENETTDIKFMWREYIFKENPIDHYLFINKNNFDELHNTIPQAFSHLIEETFDHIKKLSIESIKRKLFGLEKKHRKLVNRL